MGKFSYTLIPSDIGSINAFGKKRTKIKGCAIRHEYERWSSISQKASANGVEMDEYHKVMYGYRCPLVKMHQ